MDKPSNSWTVWYRPLLSVMLEVLTSCSDIQIYILCSQVTLVWMSLNYFMVNNALLAKHSVKEVFSSTYTFYYLLSSFRFYLTLDVKFFFKEDKTLYTYRLSFIIFINSVWCCHVNTQKTGQIQYLIKWSVSVNCKISQITSFIHKWH